MSVSLTPYALPCSLDSCRRTSTNAASVTACSKFGSGFQSPRSPNTRAAAAKSTGSSPRPPSSSKARAGTSPTTRRRPARRPRQPRNRATAATPRATPRVMPRAIPRPTRRAAGLRLPPRRPLRRRHRSPTDNDRRSPPGLEPYRRAALTDRNLEAPARAEQRAGLAGLELAVGSDQGQRPAAQPDPHTASGLLERLCPNRCDEVSEAIDVEHGAGDRAGDRAHGRPCELQGITHRRTEALRGDAGREVGGGRGEDVAAMKGPAHG